MKYELKKLEKFRKEKGYSYKDLADKTGYSKSYVWQIIKGKRKLSYEQSIILSKVFNKKPDEIFYDEFSEQLNKKTT